MNAEVLKKHYQSLLNDLDKMMAALNVPEEISQTVFTTVWVRIFLIGDVKTKQISVHVEISHPRATRFKKDIDSKNSSELDKTSSLREILENQIIHLEYLATLHDEDFVLGFIGEEGTWYATKMLETEPVEELYDLLVPHQFRGSS